MPRIKCIFTFLLAAVLLIPAISAHDDAIRLSVFQSGAGQNDSLIAAQNLSKTDFNSALAALLDGLDTIHIGNACILSLNITSAPLHPYEVNSGCNRSVAAPVGRAPPA